MNIPPVVTEAAFERIALIKKEKAALRIAVDGGGCSGFQYRIELVDAIEPDDLVLGEGDAKLVIDPVSLPYMSGAKIDFVKELIGARFDIQNPNVESACGCGNSFSIL